MHLYFFPARESWRRLGTSARELQRLLERLAAGTDTSELVVAVHLARRPGWSGGTAYVRQWLRPANFYAVRGKWRLREAWELPDDLPERFKLIRLLLPDDGAAYPMIEKDRYGWRHQFATFSEHLGFFFAHELHHFRRFHLGLHPREGEHSANAWAVEHCRKLGLEVHSARPSRKKTKKRSRQQPTFWQLLNPADFLPPAQAGLIWRRGGKLLGIAVRLRCRNPEQYIAAKMRHIEQLSRSAAGARLWITFDPHRRYLHAPARLVRLLRRPSLRAVIETADGKLWRWPLTWLASEPPQP
jgi:hypothetical protein